MNEEKKKPRIECMKNKLRMNENERKINENELMREWTNEGTKESRNQLGNDETPKEMKDEFNKNFVRIYLQVKHFVSTGFSWAFTNPVNFGAL